MTELFKKLNYKNHQEIIILNAPISFSNEMQEMSKFCMIGTHLPETTSINFILNFVLNQTEINSTAKAIVDRSNGDAIIWYAFPKKSSKNFTCNFNRDNGWEKIGELGLEGVRMVAIDEDWTTLRFRKVAYIKNMSRSFAMTEAGKLKAKKCSSEDDTRRRHRKLKYSDCTKQ
ncbi:MAG: hypothetical protein IPO92_11055 [Saprospiraceae bacterium]|nr:hypothetical protein [Saprospiraceae bacterium]